MIGDLGVHITELKSLDIRPVTASTPKPGSVRDLIPDTSVQDLSEVVPSAINAVDDREIITLREKLCSLENELIEIRSKLATAVSMETISVATQTPPTVRESELFRSVAIQCGEPCGELECDKLECDDSNTQTPVLKMPSQSESCTSHAQERDQNNSDQLCVDSDPHVGQERAAASDLSNISSDTSPSELNESAKTDGNSRKETITQPKRTLLVGSSIIKDVSPRGLKDTDVGSHSGARINNIRHHIANMDLTTYKRILFQVGGNDYSSRRSLSEIQEDYCALIQETPEKMKCEAEIFVSGLPPRSDVHVQPVNILLRDICTVRNIDIVLQRGARNG